MTDPEKRLIFDIGLHNGDDTFFYLAKGFNVVAVDANPQLVADARSRFADAIANGRLTLINAAVAPKSGRTSFFVNPGHLDWSSLDRNVASRWGLAVEEITVDTISMTDLLARHGCPYYLKIDIEGGDRDALLQVAATAARPRFVSVEVHDVSYLTYLRDMGYTRFKVVNQANYFWFKCPHPALEGEYVDHKFSIYSSGLFGEETPGRWVDFEEAALLYLQVKRLSEQNDYLVSQWLDVHAST